ncbi:MAG TPA: serine hydrolase domain-containing protein [Longimicrobiales bacterium]
MPRLSTALAALAALPPLLAPAASPAALAAQEAPPAASQASLPADSTILRIIRERVDAGRYKGIVVGVLDPDGRTRVVAYGDPGAGQPPLDGNSVFEIGSITKVFTAILLADMAARGELELDDPVAKYLPAEVSMPSRDGREITLLDLAMHRSGLPRIPFNLLPANLRDPYANYTVEQLYAFLSSHELRRAPGEAYEYSNLGMGLLGHVLALRAGTSYEQLVRERVLEPLGMTHTAVDLTPWMQEHLAVGHGADGNPTPLWNLPTLAGAGALRSTTLDMLRFAAAALDPEATPLHRVIAQTQAPRADAGSEEMRIGMGWHIRRAPDRDIVWHNGGTGGYRSFLGLDLARRCAVVVLSNSSADVTGLGFHLLEPRFPLEPARSSGGT